MKDDLEDFYPWMRWPSYSNSGFKVFKQFEDLSKFINTNSEINKAIIVFKIEMQIQVKIVNTKILYLDNDIKIPKLYPCKIQSWIWKPRLISIKKMDKSILKKFQKLQKDFKFKEVYITDHRYKTNEESDFWYLLYFIESNKDWKVTINQLNSYCPEPQKWISWDVEAQSLLFVKEHHLIPVSLNNYTFKIEGIIESKITVGLKEWYVFRLLRIVLKDIIFQYDHKDTTNKNELFDQLKQIIYCDQILKFKSWYSNNIKVLVNPKDIRKISIFKSLLKQNNNWFLQSLELTPKNITVELNDIVDSRYPKFKDIIKLADEFKSISVILNVFPESPIYYRNKSELRRDWKKYECLVFTFNNEKRWILKEYYFNEDKWKLEINKAYNLA